MSAHQVLVIDDDEDIRVALIELIEDAGYTAVGAAHGAAALERLREQGGRPCVILLDLMMPVMDGWEFRAQQRLDPALAAIPVVVISAYRHRPSVTELDAAAYLNKPFDAAALMDVIRRHCR
ncbi:MAG: response regulator [Deltaproteobacteria bacterium]|nr:response regulator [Nannocystaceae bacterium]